jgi:hypothetical protein
MIVTPNFIFVRLQKCASRTLAEFFKSYYSSKSKVEGIHVPASKIKPKHPDRMLVSSIRNPWEWYVSWHTFIANDCRYVDFYHKDFKQFIKNIYSKKSGIYSFINFGVMHEKKIGVYTHRYRKMTYYQDRCVIDYWIRVENIVNDTMALLERFGYKTDGVVFENKNKTNHKHYSEYYDDEIKEMVAFREAEIIKNHKYEFEDML